MSYMRGDLLMKTRKLVKGLAKTTPVWLKAMEQAPPVTFPRTDGKIKKIEMPEDVYVKRFFKKHPDSLYHDAVKMEYRVEKKAKKKAPPPNPYPSAIKEIQAEEKKYVHDRFFNPKILEIVQKMKAEKAARMQDQQGGGDSGAGGGQPRGWNGEQRWCTPFMVTGELR